MTWDVNNYTYNQDGSISKTHSLYPTLPELQAIEQIKCLVQKLQKVENNQPFRKNYKHSFNT